MTSKNKAFWAALLAGLLTIAGIVAEMPTSLQNQIAQPFPEATRGYIGMMFLVLGWLGRTYATHQAAASGPQTPPVNPAQ